MDVTSQDYRAFLGRGRADTCVCVCVTHSVMSDSL